MFPQRPIAPVIEALEITVKEAIFITRTLREPKRSGVPVIEGLFLPVLKTNIREILKKQSNQLDFLIIYGILLTGY